MNWTDIQQWEAAPLQKYAVECENKQRKLQAVGDALGQRLDSLIGSGQTVKAAKAALRKQIMAIEKEVNFLISSAEIASEGAQGINEVRANADDAKQLANTWGMSIDASGNVSIGAAEVKRLKKAGKNILDIKYMVDTAQKRVTQPSDEPRNSSSLSRRKYPRWTREPTTTTFTTLLPRRCVPRYHPRSLGTGSRVLVELSIRRRQAVDDRTASRCHRQP